MSEIRQGLLFLIEILELVPLTLFITCILKAMPKRKQQPYNHPGQMTIFQIQQPEPTIDISQVDIASPRYREIESFFRWRIEEINICVELTRKEAPLELRAIAQLESEGLARHLPQFDDGQHRIYTRSYPMLPDPWLLPLNIPAFPMPLQLPQPSAPKLLLLPGAREQTDYAALNSARLRALCSERGIRWRGVRRGKHLTKIQMVERLVAATA